MEQQLSVPDEPEQVSGFSMTVALAEESPESKERWEQRASALAAWLFAEWQKEHPEAE